MKPPPFFVGSLPYLKPELAIDFVKAFSSHLPFLPQLPEANEQEDMIGQVLRGFELGHWDEKASSCLELFQNEFADAPRCKIQVAGPFTVAKSLSMPFDQTLKQWLSFWDGLKTQLRQGAFRGELWLQIDEPFWGKKQPFPTGYDRFLEKVRTSRVNLRVGLHSCATDRPRVEESVFSLCDFFSLDFTKTPLIGPELEEWDTALGLGKTILVYGGLQKNEPLKSIPLADRYPQKVWLSAPCGLFGWSPEEIANTYGSLAKRSV